MSPILFTPDAGRFQWQNTNLPGFSSGMEREHCQVTDNCATCWYSQISRDTKYNLLMSATAQCHGAVGGMDISKEVQSFQFLLAEIPPPVGVRVPKCFPDLPIQTWKMLRVIKWIGCSNSSSKSGHPFAVVIYLNSLTWNLPDLFMILLQHWSQHAKNGCHRILHQGIDQFDHQATLFKQPSKTTRNQTNNPVMLVNG